MMAKGAVELPNKSDIKDKLEKCYSEERYGIFQEHVKNIVIETLGSKAGRAEIKEYATEATKDFLEQNTWKKLTFWIPTIAAIIASAVAIWATFFKP